MPSPPQEEVTLRLSKDHALVLFELVSRFSEKKKLSIEDPAEERVLWDICCSLEATLTQPLNADYAAALAKARQVVRNEKLA